VWLDWEFGRGGAGVEVGDGFGGESDFMICFGVWGFRGWFADVTSCLRAFR